MFTIFKEYGLTKNSLTDIISVIYDKSLVENKVDTGGKWLDWLNTPLLVRDEQEQSLYHNTDKQQRKWNSEYCYCGLLHEVKMAQRRGK